MAVTRSANVKVSGRALDGSSFDPSDSTFGEGCGFQKSAVSFNREKFAELLRAQGYPVIWEKAVHCPFRRGPNPRDHDINCPSCDGSGFVYYDAVPTRMLFQSIKLSENYYAYGRHDSGTSMVTALPGHHVSFWDRLTLVEAETRFTELVYRDPNVLSDRLKFNPTRVDHVIWADRAGKSQVLTNFEVSTDLGLVWLGTQRPDDRDYYSVSYFHRPEYKVIDLVHQIRQAQGVDDLGDKTSQDYPVQVIAQMSFAVRNEGEDAPDADRRQNPFAP